MNYEAENYVAVAAQGDKIQIAVRTDRLFWKSRWHTMQLWPDDARQVAARLNALADAMRPKL